MLDSTTLLALLLVLASAAAHATWNLLLKKARQQEVFAWWLSAFAVLGALPIALPLALLTPFDRVGVWYVIATSLVHICYFLFLGRSLARSDLSLVYPIARGFGPGVVPILAVLLLGETVGVLGWVGIAAIVIGIYTTAWWGQLRQFTTWATLSVQLTGIRLRPAHRPLHRAVHNHRQAGSRPRQPVPLPVPDDLRRYAGVGALHNPQLRRLRHIG